jgi:4-hydroxy-tetrahydrodipicolinate synthase
MALAPQFFTAIATPLNTDDSLHEESLRIEIAHQLHAGIHGLLVAGTMGAMPLLSDETYQDLVRWSAEFARGRGELLVGAGDTSFSRTVQRIHFLNTFPIDGVMVTAPYYAQTTQEELLDYFTALADESHAPLFLYDHPQSTRVKLAMDTVATLADHPNIRGIKCSDDPAYMRQLLDRIGDRFRVLIAAPLLMDVFLRYGACELLDGVFCLCPSQVVRMGRAATEDDWQTAARMQQGINELTQLLIKYGVWPSFNALLNQIGVPGKIRPRPYRMWGATETELFLADTETQAVLSFLSDSTVVDPTVVLSR